MENKNKKAVSGQSSHTNPEPAGKTAGPQQDPSHEKHVEAGHKGAEACCKKMGPQSACCGKK